MSQNIEAGREYRLSSPQGVSKDALSTDAPSLLPLLDQNPSMLVYTRSNPEFSALRAVFNTAVDIVPLAIIRPQTEAEATLVIAHCTHHKIPISVRSGGHDFWGRSLVSGGVVVDMAAMDSVVIAGDRTYARIGGGTIGSNLLSFLEEHNLFTPVGFCSSVGYVGWATGAGYGLMQGSYGLGVDQILGARIIVANGQIVDTDSDPELLWSIRGAGSGTLGLIVEMRVKLYKNPKILGGLVVFDYSDVGRILKGFDELTKTNFPDSFSGDFIVPYLPGMGRVLAFLFAWPDSHGNFIQAKLYLEKIRKLGTVLLNTVNDSK